MVNKLSGSLILIALFVIAGYGGLRAFAQDDATVIGAAPPEPGMEGMVSVDPAAGAMTGAYGTGFPGATNPGTGTGQPPEMAGPTQAQAETVQSDSAQAGQAQTYATFDPDTDIQEIAGDDGGEQISLDLRNIDLIEIFKVLSIRTNTNIVPTQAVRGRVSLYLNNVTFEDALDVILVSQKLAAEQRGDVLVIMTGAEYKTLYGRDYNVTRESRIFQLNHANPGAVFKALDSIKSGVGKIIVDSESGTIVLIDTPESIDAMYETAMKLDTPLETRAFELQYADAEDIKAKLEGIITTGVGKVTVDERTNSVVVTDLPGRMVSIVQMLSLFDQETRVVFIEAQILEIELQDRYQQGVNWEKFFSYFRGIHLTSVFPAAETLAQSQTLVFGDIDEKSWQSTVQLLNTLGNTRILSRPKIAVVNNAEANIMVGTREVYSTSSISQASDSTVTSEAIEFIDVGIKLNVTPTINADGFITMKIKPEVSSVVDTYTTANLSTIPIVQTSESSTTVKIKDGEMIMIAGLMKGTDSRSSYGVPLLNKIPFIGSIFGSKDTDIKTKEIIVFITPHIIEGTRQRAWDKEQLERYQHDLIRDDVEEEPVTRKGELKGMKAWKDID